MATPPQATESVGKVQLITLAGLFSRSPKGFLEASSRSQPS